MGRDAVCLVFVLLYTNYLHCSDFGIAMFKLIDVVLKVFVFIAQTLSIPKNSFIKKKPPKEYRLKVAIACTRLDVQQ